MGLRATGMETRTVAQARGDGGVSRGSCAGFGDFCGKSTILVPLCAPARPCGCCVCARARLGSEFWLA